MPLLRLLHQITNMYQNVKDTQSELKEQQPSEMKIPPPKPPPPTGLYIGCPVKLCSNFAEIYDNN